MHAYEIGQPWLSRIQPHATAPAASMGERLSARRAYYEGGVWREDRWWEGNNQTGVTTAPANGADGVCEWKDAGGFFSRVRDCFTCCAYVLVIVLLFVVRSVGYVFSVRIALLFLTRISCGYL